MDNKILNKALMLHVSSNREISPEVAALLVTANNNKTLALLYNSAGVEIGYIIYANINAYSAYAFLKHNVYPQYFHEWHEGRFTLIYRVMLIASSRAEVFYALGNFIRSKKILLYKRRDRGTLWKKRNVLFRKKVLFNSG
ncbi:hypothetical protein [Cellvibrio japonicus]|uniref:hypothetical protein n=1 Tax=Cellvibrio japonicus TaxID=155077 RepID=UPI0005A2E346|nr:hypothetical protein [Cellvibrio japonicus]QEI12067.1 hypothetical protein FY117_07400 [Cellvibrio japonicus]QEI15641.1 hypothetical protein FY116_07405 [Cellvibrio japonicus]QEI19219.1 hypothetical protein FY115_07400 [Cellvibrio japonicus]